MTLALWYVLENWDTTSRITCPNTIPPDYRMRCCATVHHHNTLINIRSLKKQRCCFYIILHLSLAIDSTLRLNEQANFISLFFSSINN